MNDFPVMVDVVGERVVVVGGGKVATKRVNVLLEHGADIVMISPTVTDGLKERIGRREIQWYQKPFDERDIRGAFMVVIATNEEGVNQAVRDAAHEVPLVNDATDSSGGNVAIPASLSRGRLTISISTNGASPHLTSCIKRDLEQQYDDFGPYVDFLYTCRQHIKRSSYTDQEKRHLLVELMDERYLNEKEQRRFIEMIQQKVV